jgi:hypothetical protein
MAMVKQSSSRYEQKRMSRLESGILAARQSGITSDQIKQIIRHVYSDEKQDREEGNVTRLDVNKWDGHVFDKEQEATKMPRQVELPGHTYEQFEGGPLQRFSRPVAKMFLDHPERLEQYNLLRDHRFSRYMAIDVITKGYSEKGNKKRLADHPQIRLLDLGSPAWQRLLEEHKALFNKMYEVLINEGLSHIQAVNKVFQEMDREYKATKGKSVSALIDAMAEQKDSDTRGKHVEFKEKKWMPQLKRRYYRRYKQAR